MDPDTGLHWDGICPTPLGILPQATGLLPLPWSVSQGPKLFLLRPQTAVFSMVETARVVPSMIHTVRTRGPMGTGPPLDQSSSLGSPVSMGPVSSSLRALPSRLWEPSQCFLPWLTSSDKLLDPGCLPAPPMLSRSLLMTYPSQPWPSATRPSTLGGIKGITKDLCPFLQEIPIHHHLTCHSRNQTQSRRLLSQ